MQKWEYMVLAPDSDEGSTALFEVGEEGWEAVCSWTEVSEYGRFTHLLFKRPVSSEEAQG
jgi:hypothetical protein